MRTRTHAANANRANGPFALLQPSLGKTLADITTLPASTRATGHADAVSLSLEDRLQYARAATQGRLVLTTSFGLEDQLLTHVMAEAGCECDTVTLDTARLFPQTYALWEETEARYGIRIRSVMPDRRQLEPLIGRMGINGFRTSVENRRACCHVRKVEPLGRALAGAAGWIVGLRADQSETRSSVSFEAPDQTRGLMRFHPLFDWTRAQVMGAVHDLGIPYNPLHDAGMPSIGCQPCTRAIQPGEDERAGRWWWEQDSARECGLHVDADGRLVRAAGVRDETA